MSRLHATERGHVIPTLCEELTTYRHARKRLSLPVTTSPATLYLLARSHAGNRLPLRVAVNGKELSPVEPKTTPAYLWYDLPLAPPLLRWGPNEFDFWTDAPGMTAWSLALELGPDRGHSFLSTDGGRRYASEGLGYLGAGCGDYVVRVRMAEGEDDEPPAIAWEDPDHPRLARLRESLPAAAQAAGPALDRARILSTWLAESWEHVSSARAAQYAPWDVETILAWGRSGEGHDGRRPIVMCVHYGAAFASCCQALGFAARCWAFTGDLDGADGHFAAEIWSPEHGAWALVDPNLDAFFFRDGVPLSARAVGALGKSLADHVSWGPGFDAQRRNPHLEGWLRESYLTGRCFRHRALWHWSDYLSMPSHAPPGHGSTAYCETALVWETADRDRGFGMFPFFADDDYFDAPPVGRG
jgi:hypothetical protein